MTGYQNELTVVRRKIVDKLFVKDNFKKLLWMNLMGVSASWDDSLDNIFLKIVKTDRYYPNEPY